MMFSLKKEVRRCFPYLFEKLGFEFIEVDNDYGGSIVVAQSDKLRIRFIYDRVDFFLDISRIEKSEKWIGFYKIMDQLSVKGKVKIEYKYSNKMRVVSRLLDQCFLSIQEFFLEQSHSDQ